MNGSKGVVPGASRWMESEPTHGVLRHGGHLLGLPPEIRLTGVDTREATSGLPGLVGGRLFR